MSLATQIISEEARRTVNRYENNQQRIRLREGGGATDAARAISQLYIDDVVEAIPEGVENLRDAKGSWASLNRGGRSTTCRTGCSRRTMALRTRSTMRRRLSRNAISRSSATTRAKSAPN